MPVSSPNNETGCAGRRRNADSFRTVRSILISLPPVAIAGMLLVFFCVVSFFARGLVLRRCGTGTREELAEQAQGALTGMAATFALFVGFAISISWGAVSEAQRDVEQHAAAIQQMTWELRNIPDAADSSALTTKLANYASAAAYQDVPYFARGVTIGLPSASALDEFETALHSYVAGHPDRASAHTLHSAMSELVASASTVSAVASRTLPGPLVSLLFIVAVLVSVVMGISTVSYGRPSLIFVWVSCLIPALSIAVVLALAYPFALRTGLTTAPLRVVAQHLAATG